MSDYDFKCIYSDLKRPHCITTPAYFYCFKNWHKEIVYKFIILCAGCNHFSVKDSISKEEYINKLKHKILL